MRTTNISMQQTNQKNQAGFSLMELVVALTITLVVMSISVTLLARTLNIRTRENEHVDELGDVQRALNIMSREIANSGFNLTNPDNGIVAADSNGQAIRIRANLNKFDTTGTFSAAARRGIGDPLAAAGEDAGEDVTYFVNTAENTNYLARWDQLAITKGTVLANRVDTVGFNYFDQKVTYTQDPPNCQITNPLNAAGVAQAPVTPDKAKFVVIVVCMGTPQVGTPGSPGFQPGFRTLLISDVALRNSRLNKY
ncbi:MAG TPA: prepilin-type N-terminal cleavage/methylation domain-containing protein [Pyrinomonadaceae bacterium]|nr:prepilin-type N-terminal cleavage/methylation domain-containing protein [Pyrinomonadaceae bacterium]